MIFRLLPLTLASVLLSPPAFADPDIDALKARLDSLEVEIDSLVARSVKDRAPESPVNFSGDEEALTIGGLIQGQADFGDRGDSRFPGNDRFYLRRARLNAGGRFAERFDFRLELDLAGSLSATTGLRAQMTDGFVTWSRHRIFQVRAGQFKTPFGYEQLYSDPLLPTIERSLANDRLTLGRQIGLSVFGEGLRRLAYTAGLFNGTGTNTNANDNDNFTGVGRLAFVPLVDAKKNLRLALGACGFVSSDDLVPLAGEFGLDSTPGDGRPDNILVGERSGLSADLQLRYGRFEAWLEYLENWMEPSNDVPAGTLAASGGYAQILGYAIPDRLQGVLKYETFDPDRDFEGNSVQTVTVGLNLFLNGDDLKILGGGLFTNLPGEEETDEKAIFRIQAAF